MGPQQWPRPSVQEGKWIDGRTTGRYPSSMRNWWVNQYQCFKHEVAGGCFASGAVVLFPICPEQRSSFVELKPVATRSSAY